MSPEKEARLPAHRFLHHENVRFEVKVDLVDVRIEIVRFLVQDGLERGPTVIVAALILDLRSKQQNARTIDLRRHRPMHDVLGERASVDDVRL